MDETTLIEQYILEAWDEGLTGIEVVEYVQYMAGLPAFKIEPVLEELITRMAE